MERRKSELIQVSQKSQESWTIATSYGLFYTTTKVSFFVYCMYWTSWKSIPLTKTKSF